MAIKPYLNIGTAAQIATNVAGALLGDMQMMLGSFKFCVSNAAYQDFSRQTEYNWASQNRIGADDALQYLGPGNDSITLTGVVYPFHGWPLKNAGFKQINKLRELAAKGAPQSLTTGMGEYRGKWVILSVDEKVNVHGPQGAPLRQEFTVKLRKYEDGSSGLLSLGKRMAAAFGF
jgi:phage protein U